MEVKEVGIEYSVEIDDGGFCVNINIEDFDEATVPAFLVLVAQNICEQQGSNFAKVLQAAMRIMKDESGAQA